MKDTMENLNQGTYIVIFYERESGEGTNGKPYRAVVSGKGISLAGSVDSTIL